MRSESSREPSESQRVVTVLNRQAFSEYMYIQLSLGQSASGVPANADWQSINVAKRKMKFRSSIK